MLRRRLVHAQRASDVAPAREDVAKQERWAKGAKAYSTEFLAMKHEACKSMIFKWSALAAANAVNPIPGIDVALDLGILLKLFAEIRKAYGLTPERLKWLSSGGGPMAAQVANRVLLYAGPAATETLIALLKRFAGRAAAKEVSKYIPIIGQVVAASIGYGMTSWAGNAYLDECAELARVMLEQGLAMPGDEAIETTGEVL